MKEYSEFERGFLIGFFASNGGFGGDGQTPQMIVRMGSDNQILLQKLQSMVDGSSLYGPYTNRGRDYFQWLLRGDSLREFCQSGILEELEFHNPIAFKKYEQMQKDYFRGEKLRFNVRRRRRFPSISESIE